jgi:hypothetical protein
LPLSDGAQLRQRRRARAHLIQINAARAGAA